METPLKERFIKEVEAEINKLTEAQTELEEKLQLLYDREAEAREMLQFLRRGIVPNPKPVPHKDGNGHSSQPKRVVSERAKTNEQIRDWMREHGEWTVSELADFMGISRNGAYMRLKKHRAYFEPMMQAITPSVGHKSAVYRFRKPS